MALHRLVAVLIGFVGLAACAPDPLVTSPAPVSTVPAVTAAPARSAESLELEAYYARVENSLRQQGLLRTDAQPQDAPYDANHLAETFVQVALFEEYTAVGGRLVPRASASTLHRWDRPIRVRVEFGQTIAPEKRQRDQAAINAYLFRLSGLIGRPIRQVSGNSANFSVFVVNEEERRALGPRLRQIVPGISDGAVQTVTDLDRTSYCLVLAWDDDQNGAYERAVAVIRGEHPDLLRLSCIHEEIAQGLGLSNDSPGARPSVFNDDEEFALLTDHDGLLLQMLYDPALRPGMTPDEARPIVRALARRVLPDEG